MKTICFFSVRLLAPLVLLFITVFARNGFAQSAPSIVWSTNAHATYSIVTDLAFSSDGNLLVSGSSDQTAKLWFVANRELLRTFSIGTSQVGTLISVAISSDGTLIGAGDGDGKARVWQISTGQRLWIAGPNNQAVYSAAFNRSNNLFCAGRDAGFRVSDGQTGQGLQLINDQSVFDSRFSPDGTLLVVGNSDSTARLYGIPAAASEPTNTFIRDFIGHSQPVMSVDFSPNGKLLATSAGDGTARLWNTTNGAQVRVFENGGGTGLSSSIFGFGVGRARFSADGKTLLTSSNSTLRFWRVSDGKLLLTYTNVGNGVIAVSPDGKHFAYGTGIGAINETNTTVYLARMPLFITEAAVRTNAFQLEWQGGTGLYHVEQRTNGILSPWQVIAGPMTNSNLSLPLTNGSRFFRIQNVEIPP